MNSTRSIRGRLFDSSEEAIYMFFCDKKIVQQILENMFGQLPVEKK